MNKKILTVDDLIMFCKKHNFNTFNSKEFGYQLCVSLPAAFNKAEDIDDDSMFYGNVKLLHCGVNRNHSCVTEEAAKKCMDTIAYKPILANFTDVNGDLDFTSHDFNINEDGSVTYFEKQVGCFTADKPYMKQDPEHEDRKFVYAKCAIPRQYTAAADIIERKGGTKISAELGINRMSYDSQNKQLMLEDVVVLGCTLLGVDPDTGEPVLEGMESARLQIEDFSAENNSVIFNKSELIDEITQAVIDKLDNHTAKYAEDNTTERRDDVAMENENIKDVEFEETEVDEAEVEATEEEKVPTDDETAETPEVVMDSVDNEELKEPSENEVEPESNDVNFDDEALISDLDSEGEATISDDDGKKKFNINGMNFEVSMSEVMYSLYELVNNSYGETDNDYYSVDVYEGSKTVVMTGMFSGRSYRQGYKVRNNVYSLVGDRTPVKVVYVTPEEEAELDRMRSNYSEISEKLAKYEDEPKKMEILNSSDYIGIAELADFVALKEQENHFDLTVDELREKADAMLLQYVKAGKFNFAAADEKKEEPKKDFFAFARVEVNNNFLDKVLKEAR